ncbi:MAG: polysaccharide biosynthesis/export family protein [Syntrophales bacterium]
MKGKLQWLGIAFVVIMAAASPGSTAEIKGTAEIKKSAKIISPGEGTYIIGPEDVLFIHVWREEALSRAVPVRADGKISMPIVDDIQAAGLTPMELKNVLTEKFRNYIDNPTISVIVTEANSFRIFVSGQVRNPGIFRLRSETSLLQIIPMAGGFTEWADQKKIVILRKVNGKDTRMTVNYKKIVENPNGDSDVVLKPGDTVIVP